MNLHRLHVRGLAACTYLPEAWDPCNLPARGQGLTCANLLRVWDHTLPAQGLEPSHPTCSGSGTPMLYLPGFEAPRAYLLGVWARKEIEV